MHRTPLLAVLAAGLVLALGAIPASAQDILGLSMRPTGEMASGTPRGSVDIISDSAGKYAVNIDLSSASEGLTLAAFEGAKAFVVWAVDTDGVRHNVGTLDGTLVLNGTVDYQIARLALSAEADAATTSPTGPDLFAATLRSVQERSAAAPKAQATAAATKAAGTTAATAAPAPTKSAPPKELPTTGNTLPDVLVWAAVAVALLVIGLRLRGVRV